VFDVAQQRGQPVKRLLATLAVSFATLVASPRPASAHCDSMDGPVIKVAQKALETGKIGLVLAWVKPAQEAEVKTAFQKVMTVRRLGPEAREIADQHFFETLVRIHRAGEGAPFTGLKPAGQDFGPAIPAADKALETGNLDPVLKLLTATVDAGLKERFKKLKSLRAPGDDAATGREWVEAYVVFLHYAQGIYQTASGKTPVHENEDGSRETHAHAD
jgi:hypothetical protein